jgi:hypothetical protein
MLPTVSVTVFTVKLMVTPAFPPNSMDATVAEVDNNGLFPDVYFCTPILTISVETEPGKFVAVTPPTCQLPGVVQAVPDAPVQSYVVAALAQLLNAKSTNKTKMYLSIFLIIISLFREYY